MHYRKTTIIPDPEISKANILLDYNLPSESIGKPYCNPLGELSTENDMSTEETYALVSTEFTYALESIEVTYALESTEVTYALDSTEVTYVLESTELTYALKFTSDMMSTSIGDDTSNALRCNIQLWLNIFIMHFGYVMI